MLKQMKPGDCVILALLLLPVVVYLPGVWPASGSSGELLRFAGRLAGVAGLSAMLVAAMLSLRLPRIDRFFGGLPRIWAVHRMLGFTAFLLIMLHVLFLALAALPSSLDLAITTLFPPVSHTPVWMGWAAFVLMLTFLGPTFQFFGRPVYQRWKRLHLLSAPALILAAAHAIALLPSGLLWWLMAALALGAITWRKVLSPQLGRHDYTVEQVAHLTPDVVELSLSPRHQAMTHEAGQFVYLTPFDSTLTAGHREEHPYTVASAPDDPHLRIGIKALGDASRAIQNIAPGSRVAIEGPYGDFFERKAPARKQLWLGGGIGITPFVSGARAMANQADEGNHVFLLYLANRPARAYYLNELERIGETRSDLTAAVHYFSEHGPVDEAFMQENCPDFTEREIYICGPAAMQQHLLRLLEHAGVSRNQIHTEAFDFL